MRAKNILNFWKLADGGWSIGRWRGIEDVGVVDR
jgi:hypothetical protein